MSSWGILSASQAGVPLIDIDHTIFVQFVLFLILMKIATRWLFRPFIEMSEKRTTNIEGAKQHAHDMLEEMSSLETRYTQSLTQARLKANATRQKFRTQTHQQRDTILDNAKTTASEKINNVQTTITQSKQIAHEQLLKETHAMGCTLASKILGRDIS